MEKPKRQRRVARSRRSASRRAFPLVGIGASAGGLEAQPQERMSALQESRAKLEAAFGSMTEAIFIADAKGRLTDFNDEFVRYHRFKDRAECSKTIGKCPDYLDVFFEDGRPAPLKMGAMARALRGETATNVEYKLRRKDTGETWWGSYSFAPMKDKDGRIVGGIVAGREITERKRAEKRLQESEQRLAGIVGSAMDAIISVDTRQRIVMFNAAAERMFGLPVSKVIGRPLGRLIPKRFRSAHERHIREFSRTGVTSRQMGVLGEISGLRANGEEFPIEASISQVKAEGQKVLTVILRDITERKRAEAEVRASEQRLALAVSGARMGMLEWNVVTGKLFMTQQHARLLGLRTTTTTTRTTTTTTTTTTTLSQEYRYRDWARRVHPEDRARVEAEMRGCMAKRVPSETEYRVIWPDKSVHWIASRGVFQYAAQGQPLRMLGITMDVTERKRTEAALRDLTTDLERRVEERTAQLRAEIAQREHLERQVLEISEREQRRIGQDLHDGLGQRLATTRYQLGALSLRLAKKKLPDAPRAAEIERLLQQALEETGQIARGLHPVRPEGEGLMAALYELADSVTKLRRIPCQLICRGRILVHDYPTATNLYRIAQEAVNNAVRHAQPKHVRILLQQAGQRVHLRVEDDGRGLRASAKFAHGLGLGIMRYRASSIGATFAISPRRGGGTVITCDWKLSPVESHAR